MYNQRRIYVSGIIHAVTRQVDNVNDKISTFIVVLM